MFLFYFIQFSLTVDNSKQKKCTPFAFATLYAEQQKPWTLFKECYSFLTMNCPNSTQKQTEVNSIPSTMHIGSTLTCTAVGMKLYQMHILSSVINTTWTSRWCGLTDTWQINYNSNFRQSPVHTCSGRHFEDWCQHLALQLCWRIDKRFLSPQTKWHL
jgi:hypothetical protein